MLNNSLSIWVVIHVVFFCVLFPDPTTALGGGGDVKEGGGGIFPVPATAVHGTVVKKEQRWLVASSEFGEISAVKVSDGKDGFYHLQFITMEPNSLFLPVHLHSDMVFYVDSGNGTLSWTNLEEDDGKLRQVKLQAGDVYRLRTGAFFYLQSNLESDRRKLRVHAIFSDSKEELREGSSSGAYSSVRDLVLGFDNKVLQAALNVKEEVIEELKQGERQAIVHGVAETVKQNMLEVHYGIMRAFLGGRMNINFGMLDLSKKKEKKEDKKKDKKEDKKKDDEGKPYNVLDAKRDVENCNGWSLVVTSQQLDALNDSNFGVFMVNLSRGAMMGPHWNPTTVEIAVVLRGRGMVNVVCPSATNGTECKNSRFKVEEGDVFVVPRYHPMAQMSFNDDSLVFVGFTTTTKNNHPQYLAGSLSVFQTLDKMVLAASFGVSNTTMDQVLSAQREAIILECISCAEEEERLAEEEIAREKEEARKRDEEAERKKEEEEARRQEEEKRKKEEEEEARRQEEEAEKARKEEEEEARRQEEEKRKKEEEEEEEARQQEEAAKKARKEEEARKREEEEARKREEEEAARQQEDEEAARRRKEEEEAWKRKQEEEAAKQWQQQQEEEAKRKQEEEAASQWQRQQEEEAQRQQEEAAAKERQRQQEEAAAKEPQRQQEEAAAKERQRQQEEAAKEWQRQQEEEAKRKQEEAVAKQWQRQQEEEAKRRQEEKAARHQQGGGGGGGGAGWEGEASRREEEEMQRREREAEAASEAGGGGGGWQGNGRYEGY